MESKYVKVVISIVLSIVGICVLACLVSAFKVDLKLGFHVLLSLILLLVGTFLTILLLVGIFLTIKKVKVLLYLVALGFVMFILYGFFGLVSLIPLGLFLIFIIGIPVINCLSLRSSKTYGLFEESVENFDWEYSLKYLEDLLNSKKHNQYQFRFLQEFWSICIHCKKEDRFLAIVEPYLNNYLNNIKHDETVFYLNTLKYTAMVNADKMYESEEVLKSLKLLRVSKTSELQFNYLVVLLKIKEEKYDEALVLVEAMSPDTNPARATKYTLLAHIYTKQGKLKDAKRFYFKALELESSNVLRHLLFETVINLQL